MKNYWLIGDIHGELGLLRNMLRALESYEPERLIFLGDLIDRGPDPKGVIDAILGLDVASACLMGNHELMMLNALEDSISGNNPMELWYNNGGESTLLSFGLPGFFGYPLDLDKKYYEFLRGLHTNYLLELNSRTKILATHAGISPQMSVEEQLKIRSYSDLQSRYLESPGSYVDSFLWTRDAFFNLSPDHWEGYLVVHGHTPVNKLKRYLAQQPSDGFHFIEGDICFRRDVKTDRLVSVDIDSGAVISGRLTALGFLENPATGSIEMRSVTVSREDVFPRNFGPV